MNKQFFEFLNHSSRRRSVSAFVLHSFIAWRVIEEVAKISSQRNSPVKKGDGYRDELEVESIQKGMF